jgi:hypothetical protein
MAVTTAESTTLHRTVEDRHDLVVIDLDRYGDRPAERRLRGGLEPNDPDASVLDDLTPLPAASTAEASDIQMLDEIPVDPNGAAGAGSGDEGGFRR